MLTGSHLGFILADYNYANVFRTWFSIAFLKISFDFWKPESSETIALLQSKNWKAITQHEQIKKILDLLSHVGIILGALRFRNPTLFLHWFVDICSYRFYFRLKMVPELGPESRTHWGIWLPRLLSKRLHNADSILAPISIPFLLTFDTVFDTSFVDLELAQPPNHGKWLSSFSRLRRLRSASTMACMPFPIMFLIFP